MDDRYIVHFISRTRKKMLNFIKEKLIEENLDGLIPSHGNVLTALYENNGKLTMKKIAEITKKDKSTITPLINKLLELGYIIKVKDEKDKRVTYIILTEKGKEIKGKYNTISNEVYNTAYKNFSEEEKEIFLKLLKKMNNNFNSNS
ncbi:MarR family transcriptional regulator [Clostridium sp. cel8]|uniref:MarR family winged helix-turn-helix transcriptional regulator n=1 Tax=Clostridium sp. cel8 TaxID=2663123 RepID=UPI0015F52694|nr:MarR family transcriptional regulator [Clostridium sp. cel8]MBA5850112.1 MarR family transcriptional regulator [Clostridium sp. cel8]